MKIAYTSQKFNKATLDIIQKANQVIAEYMAKGFKLTLRQLYYQFVSRDWIPNKQKEYKRLGSIISNGRLAGLIDWDAIEDRGRNLIALGSWNSPADIISACASQFRIDRWKNQDVRVEVWIEKEALIGVVAPVCNRWRIPHFACKGYVSQSEMRDAGANRLRRYIQNGQTPIVLHFGDHDPSGIDMTRDIRERVSMFAGRGVEIRRLALNMQQIEEYDPPPNPAKETDARFEDYRAIHGNESWELDALNPEVIAGLIETEVRTLVEIDRWDESGKEEDDHRASLTRIHNHYQAVADFALRKALKS